MPAKLTWVQLRRYASSKNLQWLLFQVAHVLNFRQCQWLYRRWVSNTLEPGLTVAMALEITGPLDLFLCELLLEDKCFSI